MCKIIGQILSVEKGTRKTDGQIYYVIKFGAVDAMLNSKRYTPKTDVSQNAAVFHYLDSLEGQLCYVLQIEPDNDYFKNILPEFKKIKAEYLRN